MWVGNPKLIEIYETLQEMSAIPLTNFELNASNSACKKIQKNVTMKVLWFNNCAATAKILLLVCQSRKTIFIYLLQIYE